MIHLEHVSSVQHFPSISRTLLLHQTLVDAWVEEELRNTKAKQLNY